MENDSRVNPDKEYSVRKQARMLQSRQASQKERIVGNLRLLVFLIALGMAYFCWTGTIGSWWWLILPFLAFIALLIIHEKVERKWRQAESAVRFYERGIARLEDRWRGQGYSGDRYRDEKHPYSADLDLFGKSSLFERLCLAKTKAGQDTLADWLLRVEPPGIIRDRQEAVRELASQINLREELFLLGSEIQEDKSFHAVASWGLLPPLLRPRWPRWLACALGTLSLISFLGWFLSIFGGLDPESTVGAFFERFGSLPFLIVLLIQATFSYFTFRPVHQVLGEVEKRGRDLALLSRVLDCLEKSRFSTPRLQSLHRKLKNGDGTKWKPSQRIGQLGNLIDILNSRRNAIFAPFSFLLMMGTQVAYAIENWRDSSGRHIQDWLSIVGEFEALCSLATFAFENPAFPYPIIEETGVLYHGKKLAHPLLPRGKAVPNDITLDPDNQVLIISGSNMSGKSTFLRTLGINAVLAFAGSPVMAESLKISPLTIAATLRIQDSLQEGKSRFYAEILRVRQVVDLSKATTPLFFLLDEIFAGTNSSDRRLGAEAVVRSLVNTGAIGLVTTHDLTLTRIGDNLGSLGKNAHFADYFEEGVMKFDYKLHPGVVQNSNAIALMRAVGLEL